MSGVSELIVILSSVLFLALPQLAQAQELTRGGAAPKTLGENYSEVQCKLENCWKELFPTLRDSVQNGADLLNAYVKERDNKIERADNYDRKDEFAEKQALQMKLFILQKYLEECEDLKSGPSKSRFVIVLGHQFEGDSGNFNGVLFTKMKELIEERCKTPSEVEACKKQIVVKFDTNKTDLHNYFRFLGNNSAEVNYIGHGIGNALVLGPKNLLLPKDWDPSLLKITEEDWFRKNTGMLYSNELEKVAKELARVLKPKSHVEIYACDTGKVLAPQLRGGLAAGGHTVSASKVGMHFIFLDTDNIWKSPGDQPVPNTALKVRLVPDVPGEFRPVPAANGSKPADDKKATAAEANRAHPDWSPFDRAARDIVLRLTINSAEPVAQVDNGKRTIFFSVEERNALQSVFGANIRNKELNSSVDRAEIEKQLSVAAEKASTPEVQKLYKQLSEKVRDCVQESVNLYYQEK